MKRFVGVEVWMNTIDEIYRLKVTFFGVEIARFKIYGVNHEIVRKIEIEIVRKGNF